MHSMTAFLAAVCLLVACGVSDAYIHGSLPIGRATRAASHAISRSPRMALAYSSDEGPLSESSQGRPGEIIRDYVPGPKTSWRFGKPDYTGVNEEYFKNRKYIWAADSLEGIVSKVVKNWEVESHHVRDPKDWQTMDVENFQAFSNGLGPISAQTMADVGPYNMMLGDCPFHKYFGGSQETFESANEKFTGIFTKGFAWEVIEVFSGPPVVSCTWRHWGHANGEFMGVKGNGQLVEMIGSLVAKLNDDGKIRELQVFFDREQFMSQLYPTQPKGIKGFFKKLIGN